MTDETHGNKKKVYWLALTSHRDSFNLYINLKNENSFNRSTSIQWQSNQSH